MANRITVESSLARSVSRPPRVLGWACACVLAGWTAALAADVADAPEPPYQVTYTAGGQAELSVRDAVCRFEALSRVEGMQPGEVQQETVDTNTVRFFRTWQSPDDSRSCMVQDTLVRRPESIEWTVTVSGGTADPWCSAVLSEFRFPSELLGEYWTAWGDPRPAGGDRAAWTDPLVPVPLADRVFAFGGRSHTDADAVSLPVLVLCGQRSTSRIAVVHWLDGPIVEMRLQTAAAGVVSFIRDNRRIVAGRPFSYRMSIYPRVTGWRDAVRRFRDANPRYMEPQNPSVLRIAGGHGAYSEHEGPIEAYLLHRQGLTFNWKAGLDYVYMGMYLPKTEDDTWQWTNPRAAGWEVPPFPTSTANLRAYSSRMRKLGFHVLNYMNPAEVGVRVAKTTDIPPRKATREADLWQDANDLVYYALRDAVLFPKGGSEPHRAWEDGVLCDIGVPVFQGHLVEQIDRHLRKIPDSSGFVFDRTDFLRFYNWARDDGVSWADGAACGSLALSWQQFMQRIGPTVHGQGKVILANPLYRRPDLYEQVDGFYDEFGYAPLSLSLCSLLALSKPYVAWTWGFPKEILHECFQRHLYMGATMTAPFPANNHTLKPGDPEVDQGYVEYGQLFRSLQGRRWLLEDGAFATSVGLVNGFEVPGGVLAVIVMAEGADEAMLDVRSAHPVLRQPHFLEFLRPGDSDWQPLPAHSDGVRRVPLRHGCALVRAVHTKITPEDGGLLGPARYSVETCIDGAKITVQRGEAGSWSAAQAYTGPQAVLTAIPMRFTVLDKDGRVLPCGVFEREWTVCDLPRPLIAPTMAYVDQPQQITVTMVVPVADAEIRYTLDGTDPAPASPEWEGGVAVHEPCILRARVFLNGVAGPIAEARFVPLPPLPPAPDVPLGSLVPLKATVGVPNTKIGNGVSWSGGPLALAGHPFAAGIGTCAVSELVYPVEPEYRRFVAVVGIDDAMRDYPQALVTFKLYADSRDGTQAAEAIAGETLLLETEPLRAGRIWPIDVAIPDGTKRIRLVVGDGGNGIDCDHADWADAGFIIAR